MLIPAAPNAVVTAARRPGRSGDHQIDDLLHDLLARDTGPRVPSLGQQTCQSRPVTRGDRGLEPSEGDPEAIQRIPHRLPVLVQDPGPQVRVAAGDAGDVTEPSARGRQDPRIVLRRVSDDAHEAGREDLWQVTDQRHDPGVGPGVDRHGRPARG